MRRLKQPAGFTLIELMVVIAIIISLLAMGALAMGDFFSQGNFNLGVRAVVNAIRAARQHAVGNRIWVLLELVDTETSDDPDDDRLPDYVALYEEVPETNPSTGKMVWKHKGVLLEKVFLPKNVELVLDTMGPFAVEDPDRGLTGLKGYEFFPSGASRPSDGSTFLVKVLDLVTRHEAKIYIYEVTSFVKVRVKYSWE